jgi:hypothetical protein
MSAGEAVKLYFGHCLHRDNRTNQEKEVVVQKFIESLSERDTTEQKGITKAD